MALLKWNGKDERERIAWRKPLYKPFMDQAWTAKFFIGVHGRELMDSFVQRKGL